MPRPRRSFTPEYWVEAVHLVVIDGHRRVAQVAHELHVHGEPAAHTWCVTSGGGRPRRTAPTPAGIRWRTAAFG